MTHVLGNSLIMDCRNKTQREKGTKLYVQIGRHPVIQVVKGTLVVLGGGSGIYHELGRVQGRCSLAGCTSS